MITQIDNPQIPPTGTYILRPQAPGNPVAAACACVWSYTFPETQSGGETYLQLTISAFEDITTTEIQVVFGPWEIGGGWNLGYIWSSGDLGNPVIPAVDCTAIDMVLNGLYPDANGDYHTCELETVIE